MEIWNVPRGVPAPVLIVMVTFAGPPENGNAEGKSKLHAAPAGKPLQERVTSWLNVPDAVTSNAVGAGRVSSHPNRRRLGGVGR